MIGLQRLLNLLYSFCQVKDLIVNTIKTKVVVYKNGGIHVKTEHWTYDGVALEIVPCFTYVGLNFTRQLSLTLMASEHVVKAKRILISIDSNGKRTCCEGKTYIYLFPLTLMASEHVVKAKRILISILSKLNN